MQPVDPARALFSEFMSDGYARVVRATADDDSENPYLDYKEVRSTDGSLTRDERVMLGQAISAFANTYGGVLVLGVEAKNNRANALRPIPSISRLEKTVNDILGQIVVPPLPIETLRIDAPDSDGAGFMIVFAPSAHPKPIMSLVDHRYYIRSGSNSIKAEHPIVRSLFFACAVPDAILDIAGAKIAKHSLGAVASYEGRVETFGDHYRIDSTLMIRNTGGTTVRGCAVALPDLPGLSFKGNKDLFHVQNNTLHAALGDEDAQVVASKLFILKDHVVLYPKTALAIGHLSLSPPDDLFQDCDLSVPYAIFIDNVARHGVAAAHAKALPRHSGW